MPIYWADLHNHNNIGYGEGTIERSYAIARSFLDVYAFTPHSWWADLPSTDAKVTDYHQQGFRRVEEAWPKVLEFVKTKQEAGKFVTIPAYEWHSTQWGDYCIYMPTDEAQLIRPNTLQKLQQLCLEHGAIMIPHHCGYPQGRRGTAWDALDTSVSPVVEMFSEHGNSLESVSTFGMFGHSMGGSQLSQSVLYQLQRGFVIGFTAGTDNHFGHPGCYGEGLTALIMEDLSRENVFKALRARHTYTTSGEEIKITLNTDSGHTMGDIIEPSVIPSIELDLACVAELDHVQLFLDGRPVDFVHPAPAITHRKEEKLTPDKYLMRVALGWQGMTDTRVATWQLDLSLKDATIVSYRPHFSSGPQTTSFTDSVEQFPGNNLAIKAHTTRTNSNPNQTLLIEVDAKEAATIEFDAHCSIGDQTFQQKGHVALSQLVDDDHYLYLDDAYAIPKIKFHQIFSTQALQYRFTWDAQQITELVSAYPSENKYRSIFFKVVQKNGHLAWTSPLYLQP